MRLLVIHNKPKRTTFISGVLGLLLMVLESDVIWVNLSLVNMFQNREADDYLSQGKELCSSNCGLLPLHVGGLGASILEKGASLLQLGHCHG